MFANISEINLIIWSISNLQSENASNLGKTKIECIILGDEVHKVSLFV